MRTLSLLAGLLATFLAPAALAATVTVQVKDAGGQPAPGVAVILRTAAAMPVPPALPMVEIVQERLRFVPAVAVVTPGTRVRFTNRDTFDHHVKGNGAATFEFRIASVNATATAPQRPGEVVLEGGSGPVTLGCYLHSVMQGSVYVSDSPYHGVTDAQGQVQISGVPAGDAKVTLWHPQQIVELPPVAARVGADATVLPMALNFVPRRRR